VERAILESGEVRIVFSAASRDPAALRPAFEAAEPFPHAVIDGLFDEALLDGLLADFPAPDAAGLLRFDSTTEKKVGFYHATSRLAPRLRAFLEAMNGFETLQFLEEVTGIDGLIPDPYFGGGGPHQIESGGFLKIHADFNFHPKLKLDRRLNVLVYLNRDWREEYGGALELWNRDVTECVASIPPLFNRTVIFATSEESFHGHPKPLKTPPGVTRKSMSLYYYTAPRPDDARVAPHDTIFREPGR
jgi:hypothetical protein